ncbi:MAG: hypothetical protein A2882_16290 [Phenylobacterium sp. RIFCSPHIGHO2_01_FULL_70_10]|nr:MAG: hypothetical protein A2882_16290 [Phenylobacterium sp. RIFCSPHIGHO2_01_FULL_70_10]
MTDITQEALDAAVAEAHARFDGKATDDNTPPASQETPQDGGEQQKPQKPEWVEDKFWDAEKGEVKYEDLAKSYQELQRKLSEKPQGDQKPEGQETPAGDASAVAQALAAAGIDFNAVNAEYQEAGDVKPETRAKLEAAFGKELVDNYFAGLKAQEAQFSATYASEVKGSVGGDEQYAAMIAWARDNVPANEVAEYDRIVQGGDVAAAKMAAQAMFARFNAAGGKEPSLIGGGRTNAVEAVGYPNIQAMARDMGDPRYRTDAAFRAEVDRKVEASTALLGR